MLVSPFPHFKLGSKESSREVAFRRYLRYCQLVWTFLLDKRVMLYPTCRGYSIQRKQEPDAATRATPAETIPMEAILDLNPEPCELTISRVGILRLCV